MVIFEHINCVLISVEVKILSVNEMPINHGDI